MKICFLLNHLNKGGITTYVRTLAELLSERGHLIWVASGGGSEEKSLAQGIQAHWQIPIHTSSEANPQLIGAAFALRRYLKAHPMDILHSQTRVAQVVAAAAGFGMPLPKRVFTCHGYLKERPVRRWFPLWGNRVIAISRAVERHLEMDWKVPAKRISKVWHGIRPETAFAAPAGEPAVGSPSEAVIGALGRYSPVKGFDLLIQAAAVLKRRGIRFKLILVGEGPEETRLSKLIETEDVEDRVRLASPPPKGSPYAGFDIFCVPSRQEGFGFSAGEAMAAGKAVVATRVGGLADLIEEGQTGILVSPDPTAIADGLERLIGNPSLRSIMGEAGRSRIETVFSVDRMAEGTIAAYQKALAVHDDKRDS